MRGSTTAWEILKQTPENISEDTLYFIYKSDTNTRDGKLYLGQKLISGSSSGGGGDINIGNIGHIYIDNETLADKQILVYNETTEQWENASLTTIIDTAIGVMRGATSNKAGSSGLVPTPQAGANNKFLRGDGVWASLNIPTFDTENIFTLDNNVVSLKGFNLAPVGSTILKTEEGIKWGTAATGSLNRKITTLNELLNLVNSLDENSPPDNTIYMVANNSGNSKNQYDEYMIIEHRLEQLGVFGETNLDNYITVPQFNTAIQYLDDILNDTIDNITGETSFGLISRVSYLETNFISKADIGDLNSLIISPENTSETLVEEVNVINERLTWQDLS